MRLETGKLEAERAVNGETDFRRGDDTPSSCVHHAIAGISGPDHYNQIEVYGRTLEKAQALRDRILTALTENTDG